MKYILLMSSARTGVESYHAWSKQDVEAHMAALQSIHKDLTASGEFVATQGLTGPSEAKVVRGEKNGVPVTDGISPSRRSFSWAIGSSTSPTPGVLMPSPAGFPQLPDPEASPQTCRSKSGSSHPMNPIPNRRISGTLACSDCAMARKAAPNSRGEKI